MGKKILASGRFLYAVYVVVLLCGMLVLFGSILNYSAHAASKVTVILSAFALVPAAALFVYLLLRWKAKPERVFLLVSAPALIAFALLFLPNHVPDEIWHIYRVLNIEDSGASMVAPIALFPDNLPIDYAGIREAIWSNISWSDTAVVDRDMSTYLTHLYIVPGLVAKLCMLANVNPFVTIYVCRLVNAALFTVAGYWIIKLMPMAKVLTCIYLLNPLMIQQEASCSADAVTNLLALLFIACIIRAKFSDKLSVRGIVALVAVFVLMSLSKFAYALLVFLFLLLVSKIEDRRKRVAIYAGSAAVFVLGMLFVLLFASSVAYQDTLDLIRNPPLFIWVMQNTLYQIAPNWVDEFMGSALSNLDVYAWRPCIWAYSLVLLFSLVFNLGEERSFGRVEKIGIVVLVAFVSCALIVVFRNWTLMVDMRNDVIMGVQGRYFLPYLLLLFLCFSTPRASQVRKNCLVIYSCILACVFALDCYSVFLAFV